MLEISINKNPIKENGVENLFYWISQMKGLSSLKLNLGCIKLSEKSCYKLISILEEFDQLTHLDLNISENKIKDKLIEPLLKSIFNIAILQHLSLNFSKNMFTHFPISILDKINSLDQLRGLFINLAHCKRDAFDFGKLFNIVSNLKKLNHFSVKLDRIFILEEEVFNLVKSLKKNKSIKSLNLSLNECNIGSSGARMLAPLSYQSDKRTIYLEIRNNNIGYNTIEYLSKMFPKESISI